MNEWFRRLWTWLIPAGKIMWLPAVLRCGQRERLRTERPHLGDAKRHPQRLCGWARCACGKLQALAGGGYDGAVYPERTVNKPSSHQSSFHKDEFEGTYDWIC